jgi:hypothetical protein
LSKDDYHHFSVSGTLAKREDAVKKEFAVERGNLGGKTFRCVEEEGMKPKDFRRLALALDGVEEGSHMGSVDFRVGGRIFATLASVKQGYGNLMLDAEQQRAFVAEMPEAFLPVAGGWGRMGATHVRLEAVSENVLSGALRAAWSLRREKNAKVGKRPSGKKRSKHSR